MKRYLCTVAAGFALALVSTATASADIGLPLPGQSATQVSILGGQSVEKQENDADVTQEQGNDNLSIAPAIALFGDAETTNEQGNDNTAISEIDQENDVDQTQSSEQYQSLDESDSNGHCCDGQSQAGEQTTYGGDQTVEKQENDADVSQEQGNGNVSIAPAIAVFGDAEATNEQGNGNKAYSDVDQKNDVDQSQSSTQKQAVKSGERSKGYGKDDGKATDCCEPATSQAGEQKVSFGDQSVGKQDNDADVTQKQGSGNVSIAPAVSVGGGKHDSCSKCGKSKYGHPRTEKAKTSNAQGNGNKAYSDVDQKNDVDQSQTSKQKQELDRKGGCCKPRHGDSPECVWKKDDYDKPSYGCERPKADRCDERSHGHSCPCERKKDHGRPSEDYSHPKTDYGRDHRCKPAPSQTGEQRTYFGDQTVGEQRNDADVTQKQGNGNVSIAPAIAVFGDAETTNEQGNGNYAVSEVDQANSVDQSQASYQQQTLVEGLLG